MTNLNVTKKNEIIFVNLNRPEKGNSIYPDFAHEITKLLKQIKKHKDLKILVLTGSGKNFCTGADLNWIISKKNSSNKNFSEFKKMYIEFLKCDLVIVGLVQGKIYGGGLGLTAIMDIVIADQNSEFAMPEATLGLIPGLITPLVMAKLGRSHFLYHALTSQTFSAREAFSYGLIHILSKPHTKTNLLERLLQTLLSQSSESLKLIKQSVRESYYAIDRKLLLSMNLKSTKRLKKTESIRKVKSLLNV